MKWVRVRPASAPQRESPPDPPSNLLGTVRRHLTPKRWSFIRHYISSSTPDPIESARHAGFVKPSIGPKLFLELRDVIEAELVRGNIAKGMDVDEAQVVIAGLARASDDPKIQLAAARSILELHGAIGSKGAVQDRSKLAREMELIVAEFRKGIAGSKKARVRARFGLQIDVDSRPDDELQDAQDDHTLSSGAIDVDADADAVSVDHTRKSRAQD